MRVKSMATGLLVATALVVSACGTQVAPGASSSNPDSAQTEPSKAGSTGQDTNARGPQAESGPVQTPKLLQFTAKTVEGEEFDARSLAGKPVVLWFWAPWCPTCAAQSGHVADLADKHEGTVGFVGVSGQDQIDAMKRFVSDTGVDGFPQIADVSGKIWKRFGVAAQSTFVILDKNGEPVRDGYLEPEDLEKTVTDLA